MFYFTGTMCELLPDSVDLVKAHGHETQDKALDVLSYEEQFGFYICRILDKAKGDLEKAIKIFEKELNGFRKICDVKTICMHVSNFIVAMS